MQARLSNYCLSTTLGKYWPSPAVLTGLKARHLCYPFGAVSGARDEIAPHDPHDLLGCPSRPIKAMRIAKPG